MKAFVIKSQYKAKLLEEMCQSSHVFMFRLKFPSGKLFYFRYVKYFNVQSLVIFNECTFFSSFQSDSLRENLIIWLLQNKQQFIE